MHKNNNFFCKRFVQFAQHQRYCKVVPVGVYYRHKDKKGWYTTMTATMTRWTVTFATWENWERGTIKKATKSFKTEEEANKFFDTVTVDEQLIKKADPTYWNIKKTVKRIEVDD